MSLCDFPFKNPMSTFNGFGMVLKDNQVFIGFGDQNPHFPNSKVPLNISLENGLVDFGEAMSIKDGFWLDFAGCSKSVEIPECSTTSNQLTVYKENIEIWPNPSLSKLYVNSEKKINSYKLLNGFGQCLLSKNNLSENQFELNLENYSNGLYILMLERDGEIKLHNILKQ